MCKKINWSQEVGKKSEKNGKGFYDLKKGSNTGKEFEKKAFSVVLS